MNILKSKPVSQAPFIRTESQWAIPGHRKTRNRRFDSSGKFIGFTKPLPFVDAAVVAKVKAAHAKGAQLGKPADEVPFDMARYQPLPGKVLLSRGPLITHEKGVEIPEDQRRHAPHWVVVKIGAGVTACAVGDSVICGKGFRPKECYLGRKYYMSYQQAIVGIVFPLT